MPGFYFHAPTLFDPLAEPGDELEDVLHDAPAVVDILAKCRRFADWFAAAMRARGLDVTGPYIDESGWMLEVKQDVGFVICIFSSGAREDDALFHMVVARIGGAPERVGQIIADILQSAPEITGLEVEPD